MQIVNHQEFISIRKGKNKALEIIQMSDEFGCDVTIWLQIQNVEQFCAALLEASKKEVIK